MIRCLEADSRYLIRLVFTDLYGNKTDLSKKIGYLTVDTDSLEEERSVWRKIRKRNNGWVINPPPYEKVPRAGYDPDSV